MKRRIAAIIGALILSLLLIASCAPTGGLAPEEFYEKRTIDFTVPSSPGGTVDRFGRVWAEMFDRHLGSTSLVTNRRAAGGLEGYVHIYQGEPDGRTLGSGINLVIVLNKVFKSPGADYEFDKFSYIVGGPPEGHVMMVGVDGPYQSVADLQAGKNVVIGAGSPGSNMAVSATVVIEVLGIDGKMNPAYKGSSKRRLAIAQGELAGECGPLTSAMVGIESGMVKPLFVLGTERLKELPEVPALTELVDLEKQNIELLEMWDDTIRLSFIIVGSADIPKDRLKYLRETATDRIMKDPEFASLIQKAMARPVNVADFLTGEQLEKSAQKLAGEQESLRALFEGLLAKHRA